MEGQTAAGRLKQHAVLRSTYSFVEEAAAAGHTLGTLATASEPVLHIWGVPRDVGRGRWPRRKQSLSRPQPALHMCTPSCAMQLTYTCLLMLCFVFVHADTMWFIHTNV